ncbi:hypothetical protein WJM97_21325 [Okeanomitos corallinicola TIOX110]|uniref:Uncharacterized protein n=1 Tax=Okeanomitos corallinicola TIOX110 TaxID=3133117 RepID=A0ABZ2UWV4_9CYAN
MLTISTSEKFTSTTITKTDITESSSFSYPIEDINSVFLFDYTHQWSNKNKSIQFNSRELTRLRQYIDRLKQQTDSINTITNIIQQFYTLYTQNRTLTIPSTEVSTEITIPDTIAEKSNESNFQITQNRLIKMLKKDEEDDYGLLRPTNYSFDKAWNLLQNVYEIMKDNFPKAWVSTDDEGSITLTWSRLDIDAEISLTCGCDANKETYIYYEHGEKYGVENEFSPQSLAKWLKWEWLNQV